MTDYRKGEIENLTVDLLKEYGLFIANGIAPIFVKEKLQEKFNFDFREADLEKDLQGAIFVGKYAVKIVVNSSIENVGRKNFTYAHELGHYFLRHTLDQGKSFCSTSDIDGGFSSSNFQEVEANYFAAYFLLPKDYVRWNFFYCMKNYLKMSNPFVPLYVDKWHYGNWKIMCSWFEKVCGVSSTALKIRLEELKLLNWNL